MQNDIQKSNPNHFSFWDEWSNSPIKKGKIIVIEWTDCSGKETQSKLLIERFAREGIHLHYLDFPQYESPTGKIVGWAYLGKPSIWPCVFPEWATHVDPKIASLYFAADRLYHLPKIQKILQEGSLILDRYTYSNMAHQWGKISLSSQRNQLYEWIELLEFQLLQLPEADIKIFLHMPPQFTEKLKGAKSELDQHEKDIIHLLNAEQAYFEIVEKYHFYTIECVDWDRLKSIEEINNELYQYLKTMNLS